VTLTLTIAECGLAIDGLSISRLSIGVREPAAPATSSENGDRQSTTGTPSIVNLQSPIGSDVWAS
jgi:hypothetical protein